MKSLYRVTNAAGVTLCYQVAHDSQTACYLARAFYGIRGVRRAEFIRAN